MCHPFAQDTSGFGYFHSEQHYHQLAAAIVRHLTRGCSVLLCISSTVADGDCLTRLLEGEKAQGYAAALVSARPGMNFSTLVHCYAQWLGIGGEGDTGRMWSVLSRLMLERLRGITRVLVIEQAEALDVACYDELLRFIQLETSKLMPVVLLASPSFATELETAPLDFLNAAISARIPIERLASEEVGAFIHYQINGLAGSHATMFPSETVEAIAAASNGDPVMVNCLARDILVSAERSGEEASPPADPAPATVSTTGEASVRANGVDTHAGELTAEEGRPDDHIKTIRTSSLPAPPSDSAEPFLLRPQQANYSRGRRGALLLGAIILAAAAVGGGYFYTLAPDPQRDAPFATISIPPAVAPRAEAVANMETASVDSDARATVESSADLPPIPSLDKIAANSAPDLTASLRAKQPGSPDLTVPPSAAEIDRVSVAASDGPKSEGPGTATAVPDIRQAPPSPTPPMPAKTQVAVPTPEPSARPPLATVTPVAATTATPEATAHTAATTAETGSVAQAPETTPPSVVGSLPGSAAANSASTGPTVPAASMAAETSQDAMPAPAPETAIEPQAASPARVAEAEPSPEVTLMVRHGNRLLAAGDIIAARRFFERAASGGSADAMCGVGKSFDPLVLRQIGVVGITGDTAAAIDWYRKAADAGSNEALTRLQRLSATHQQSSENRR